MRETGCSAHAQNSAICLGKAILKARGTRSSSAGLTSTQPHQEVCLYARSQHSHSLLPRISYSSTSSVEPESESRMEPWELNWDPLSVATRPGRNATQPGHQWKWSEGSLTAKGEVDSQVRPGQGGMEVVDGKHYGFKMKLHSITQRQQRTCVINVQYQSHYGLQ